MIVSSLVSGGLITNYHCSSACAHCLYNCSPRREKRYISHEEALKSLGKVKALGCNSVHIGGGEPLLDIDKLSEALSAAAKLGVGIEYVETNSSWFKSRGQACKTLRRLMDLGVPAILVSVSPFHNEYIPFAKVKGVLEAARASGMQALPWIGGFYGDIDQFDDSMPHSLEEYAGRFGGGYLESLPMRHRLTLRGRALKTFASRMRETPLEELLARSSPCHELDETFHFHVDCLGGYIPGLCTGLSIMVEDLGTELDKDAYPFLTTLHEEGVAGLLEKAKPYGFVPAKKGYASKCELCVEARGFLVNSAKLRTKDLNPVEYYSA